MNNPQHFFPIFPVIELLSRFHQLKLGNRLNFHVDKELPKFLVNVIHHQNDIAILKTLPVEIGLKFRDNRIASLLVHDAELLDLVNNTKVCGNIHALVMGRRARVTVNFADKLFQMHAKHSKTNKLKVGRVKFYVLLEQQQERLAIRCEFCTELFVLQLGNVSEL